MVEFNFKSQRATTIEQSERLIALGLKKETADLWWVELENGSYALCIVGQYFPKDAIPAWSLHRLIEMALRYVLICGISFTFNEDAYEKVIGIIEHQIKEGCFPKEYLVDLTGTDSHQDMVDAFGYAFEVMKAKKEE